MKLTKERITYITESYSQFLEMINGKIGVTPSDQPMYVRNGTYTGWVKNPSVIKPGWSIYDPYNMSWVSVRNVTYLTGAYPVYNIYTNGTNDYIVNGALTDLKIA